MAMKGENKGRGPEITLRQVLADPVYRITDVSFQRYKSAGLFKHTKLDANGKSYLYYEGAIYVALFSRGKMNGVEDVNGKEHRGGALINEIVAYFGDQHAHLHELLDETPSWRDAVATVCEAIVGVPLG